jgi:uncharacterized protein DUF4168
MRSIRAPGRSSWPFAAAIVAASWLGCVPGANAQSQGQTPPQPMPQQQTPAPDLSTPPADLSDQKLDAVAAAVEHVAGLQQVYRQRMAEAQPSDQQRIAGEAYAALEKAVTDQGLSIEEYTTILQVAQNDPDLRNKIVERIRPGSTGRGSTGQGSTGQFGQSDQQSDSPGNK